MYLTMTIFSFYFVRILKILSWTIHGIKVQLNFNKFFAARIDHKIKYVILYTSRVCIKG